MIKIGKKYIFIIIAAILSLAVSIMFMVKRKSDNSCIKIGAILPLTKSGAHFGINAKNGINMCIDEINNSGGISGKNIKYIEFDDEGDPAKAVSGYNFLKEQGVSSIIAAGTSAEVLAIVEAGHEDGDSIPIMVTAASAESITHNDNETFKNVFRVGLTNAIQGEKMAEFVKSKNAKNVAVLYSSEDDYSLGVKDAFVNKCKLLGINVSVIENSPSNSVDFHAQLSSIKAKQPDVIFVPLYYEADALIVQQARRSLGISCPIMGADGWGGVTNSISDPASLNDCFYCSAFACDDPNEFSKKFSYEYEKAFNQKPNMFSACGYDAVKILSSAIGKSLEKGHEPGSDKFNEDFINILENIVVDNCISGTIQFDGYHNPKKQVIIVQIEDGKERFYQKI